MPPRKRTPANPPAKSNVVQIRPLAEEAAKHLGEPEPKPRRRPSPNAARGRAKVGHSRTSAEAIRIADRKADVLQMRRMALSFTKIAEVIASKHKMPKYTRGDAHHDFMDALDRIIEEPARETMAAELDRLNVMMGALMPKIAMGDVQAITVGLRVQDRRSRYLGLDSPIKHDLMGTDVSAAVLNLADPAAMAEAAWETLRQIGGTPTGTSE